MATGTDFCWHRRGAGFCLLTRHTGSVPVSESPILAVPGCKRTSTEQIILFKSHRNVTAAFTEELSQQIFNDAVVAPPHPHPGAPWHSLPASSSGKQTSGRTAPLLVCRAFHRIALLLFDHTLVLHSPSQSTALLGTLRAPPDLAKALIRLLGFGDNPAAEVVQRRRARSRRNLHALRILAVRKAGAEPPAARAARAVGRSTDAMTRSHNNPHFSPLRGPSTHAPRILPLHRPTLRNPLPAAWYPAPRRDTFSSTLPFRCCAVTSTSNVNVTPPPRMPDRRLSSLTPSSYTSHHHPRLILPTALFLHAALPHARLVELLRAGTYICPNVGAGAGAGSGGWRGRAATVGSAPQVGGEGEEVFASLTPYSRFFTAAHTFPSARFRVPLLPLLGRLLCGSRRKPRPHSF
ncbi:hypothetical protein DFH06DRAFT_1465835 [Mycena polygramma]|nr:hypothetical protein DFH06DRAFT_1465835 [Mycena polygramma]